METTLNEIRRHGPRFDGWNKLLKHLGKTQADDEPVAYQTILESNGVLDAAWCLRCLPESEQWRARLFACQCAESVVHIIDDARSRNAIEVARRFALGLASAAELVEVRAVAYAAAYAAAAANAAAANAANAAAANAANAAAANANCSRANEQKKQSVWFVAYICAGRSKQEYLDHFAAGHARQPGDQGTQS